MFDAIFARVRRELDGNVPESTPQSTTRYFAP
jgi:hypothetical protein